MPSRLNDAFSITTDRNTAMAYSMSHKNSQMLFDLVMRQPTKAPHWWRDLDHGTIRGSAILYGDLLKHFQDLRNRDPLLKGFRDAFGQSAPIMIQQAVMECAYRDHDAQKKFILSVLLFQSQEFSKGKCPCSVKAIPGKGNGLVANRDIKKGEIVSFYPVDWWMNGAKHKAVVNTKPEQQAPFQDLHCWSMFQGMLGHGNHALEPENYMLTVKSIVENEGIIPSHLETYGYTVAGDTDPSGETWRGSPFISSEVWANPQCSHKNEWMVGHMANDGLFKPNQTQEEYIQAMKEDAQKRGEGAVNINLDFISVALRDIKEGEEILNAYGDTYWHSARQDGVGVSKSDEASVDKSNKGKVKKFKAKKKKFQTERKKMWNTMLDYIAGSHDDDEVRELLANGGTDRLKLNVGVDEEGGICLCHDSTVDGHLCRIAAHDGLQVQ